ncbi:MAG: branched-chain amino acid transport system permease protein, partial [Gaiellaceae bacterium]|nr:branched-chain amino acid transport system permease protein [Gaiellaceae bacterium]
MSFVLAFNTDPSYFVDELTAGLTLGAVYALVALGYTMIYGILKLLNFAHGDVYMVGAYTGYFVLTGLGGPLAPRVPIVVLILLMFLAAMVVCGLLGVVIERFAYRPLRNAPRIAPLITALGVSFFLQATAQLLFGAQIRRYDIFNLDNSVLFTKGIHSTVFGVFIDLSLIRIIVILAAIFLMIALALFVARTQIGKAMRATSYDREAAAMMGINVDRVIVVTFFIGSALAGAAGVMVGLVFSQVSTFMGFQAGLKAFTAAVIGGIGNIPGAMLGGF